MIHLVLNNQVGFTTAPHDGRSSAHATCAGKAIGAPIFHVNADDPAAVVAACQMAADFRHRWHKDVIVDVIGYRRWVSRIALPSTDILPAGCDDVCTVHAMASGQLSVLHGAQHPGSAEAKRPGWRVSMQDVCVASICLMAGLAAVQAWAQ